LGIRYQGQQGFWSELEWLYATHQNRLASGDIADHRIPEGGTPGWTVVNLRLGHVFPWFRVNGGIQNLFNEAYRLHGSGVDGYGRSAWVSADVPF
jgi:outer membrane receptor protein involved in Fe transport